MLMEILITLVFIAFGMVSLGVLQSKVTVAQVESYQRGHALMLLRDMADRIDNNANAIRADLKNGTQLTNYIYDDIGTGATQDCANRTGASLDLCQWGNTLRGAAEKSGATSVGTMVGGRGCITSPAPYVFVVTVVWQGRTRTAAPAVTCGSGQYGSDDTRRAVSETVRIAQLI